MQQKYDIPDVIPFDEIFYRTCRYNPLISAIYYCGGDIIPFLSNDIFTYAYNERIERFKLLNRTIECRKEKDIINEMGVVLDSDFSSEDILAEIKESISSDVPVYATVDRFYWSLSLNGAFYNIKHWPHFFLIIGFDDSEGKFNIIDSDIERCSIVYISYEEFSKSIESSNRWKNEPYYIPISRVCRNKSMNFQHKEKKDYKSIFVHNMLMQKDKIYAGLENIKTAENYYIEASQDTSVILKQDPEDIARDFLYIDQAKRAELYRLRKFFNDDQELLDSMVQIINNIGIMRGTYIKLLRTARNVEKCIGIIINQLNKLYALEIDYLTGFIDKYRKY